MKSPDEADGKNPSIVQIFKPLAPAKKYPLPPRPPPHPLSPNRKPNNDKLINWPPGRFPSRPRINSMDQQKLVKAKQNESSGSDSRNSTATVILDYEAFCPDELTLRKGTKVEILSNSEAKGDGWLKGKVDGKIGTFPSMYVAPDSLHVAGQTQHYQIRPLEIDRNELEMLEIVGRGASADVHRANWRGEEVAAKIFLDYSNDKMTKMFRNEAKVFWLLRHPNIIPMRGMCTSLDKPMLIMEFARGGILHDAIKEPLPPQVVVDWAMQLARGMRYLHDETPAPIRPLIHRDLKSKNIVLKEEIVDNDYRGKTLKITDFGLARVVIKTTRMSATAGTYPWMAPEVITSAGISTASDIWSYGVVLWELLSGSVPYEGHENAYIVFGVGSKLIRLLIPASCPPAFQELLKSCLDYVPKNRPNFSTILEKLELVAQSDFVRDERAFRLLRKNWKQELRSEQHRRPRDQSSFHSTTTSTTRTIVDTPDTTRMQAVSMHNFLAMGNTAIQLVQEIYDKEMESMERDIGKLLLENQTAEGKEIKGQLSKSQPNLNTIDIDEDNIQPPSPLNPQTPKDKTKKFSIRSALKSFMTASTAFVLRRSVLDLSSTPLSQTARDDWRRQAIKVPHLESKPMPVCESIAETVHVERPVSIRPMDLALAPPRLNKSSSSSPEYNVVIEQTPMKSTIVKVSGNSPFYMDLNNSLTRSSEHSELNPAGPLAHLFVDSIHIPTTPSLDSSSSNSNSAIQNATLQNATIQNALQNNEIHSTTLQNNAIPISADSSAVAALRSIYCDTTQTMNQPIKSIKSPIVETDVFPISSQPSPATSAGKVPKNNVHFRVPAQNMLQTNNNNSNLDNYNRVNATSNTNVLLNNAAIKHQQVTEKLLLFNANLNEKSKVKNITAQKNPGLLRGVSTPEFSKNRKNTKPSDVGSSSMSALRNLKEVQNVKKMIMQFEQQNKY